ncbi:hypothetical protein OsJ_31882 [Oryza sativa Japonica Group]|uniref:Uncharacterized protein n=1 Tax=Oryza sativa subsp. japonica TaxID=39947 RepID=B9G687_ORYSJ|nr:hypothetical protein OsJ_31882 [Oryza sativa Japonica Group]
MEVAAASLSLFRTPQAHHLAELRVDGADQSPVAFSDPCAVGRKRRCLFPPFSPRKRMLLELPPFASTPTAPAPGSASPGALSSGGDRSTRTGGNGGGGGGGGGSSFSAMAERVLAPPSVSSGSGAAFAFAFLAASPKQQQPLTPMGSTASCGGAGSGFLPPDPSSSLTPMGSKSNGIGASAFLASPRPATRSANDGGGFAFFRSPEPERTAGDTTRSGAPFSAPPNLVSGPAGSPASAAAKEPSQIIGDGGLVAPPYTISSSPARKSRSSTLWSRRLAHAAAEGRTSPQPPRDEQLQITLPPPPQKVTKTVLAPATGEPSRGATLSSSAATTCCTFLTSPAKATNQEREARASSRMGGGEGATTAAAAAAAVACAGGEVVVSVTCSCGAREEFCFDHCH